MDTRLETEKNFSWDWNLASQQIHLLLLVERDVKLLFTRYDFKSVRVSLFRLSRYYMMRVDRIFCR